MTKTKINGLVDGNHVEFDFTSDIQVVCPHCNSGFVILTVGVEQGRITMLAACTQDKPGRPLFCPYCGLDTKD